MIRSSKILVLLSLFLVACSSDNGNDEPEEETFDRQAILVNWADNIIIPALENFESSTQSLEEKTNAFVAAPTEAGLADLRSAFRQAYLDFQTVSVFETGPAEMLNYRSFLNTYPTNAAAIDTRISSGSYNLELPSSYAEQGLPALDYLLNGLAATDAGIVEIYASEAHRNYLLEVAGRINGLTGQVLDQWQGEYRDSFVNNTSSSSTGSVDRFTNDYVMYYEKFLRTGKIGYPAGVFTGEPLPINAEAYYSLDLSKELYLKALQTVQDLFNGKHFGSSQSGPSYKHYLDYLDSPTEGASLSDIINTQFSAIQTQAAALDPSLKTQVETDNVKMLEAFNELQKLVVLLKLDMMQALSISVDYVDSDGD